MVTLRVKLLILLLAKITLVSGTNYYVKTGGNDKADGKSDATAWATISKVNASSFKPGDIISFRSGDTWRETLEINWSGGPGNFVKFTKYGVGKNPRIIGSNSVSGWINTGGNIWRSVNTFSNPRNLGFGPSVDIVFERFDNTAEWGKFKPGTSDCTAEYNWTFSSNYVQIYSTENPETKYKSVEIPQRNFCIVPNNNQYLHFDGLDLLYSSMSGITYSTHTNITNVSGCIIENCEIGFIGGSTGNQFGFGIECVYSDYIIRNCEIHHCGRRGISLNLGAEGQPFTVKNIVIEGCKFHHGSHTTSLDCTVNNDGSNASIDGIIFRQNIVYEDNTSKVTYPVNQMWFQNYSGNGTINNIYIYSNIFKYWRENCIATEGITGNFYVYNNTFFENNTAGGYYGYSYCLYSDTEKPTMKMMIKNNIFFTSFANDKQGSGAMVVLYNLNPSHFECDNNLFFRTNTLLRTHLINGSSYYMSTIRNLPNFWEDNSPFPSDPLFLSASDLHLKSGSPAIGSGTKLNLPSDFDGNAWKNPPSIGAFESYPIPPNHDTVKKKQF